MMKIKCPKCSTSYIIEGISKVVTRRLLRCSTCGHNWRQYLTPSQQNLTSKPLQHVFDPLHFRFSQYAHAHQYLYKPQHYTAQEKKYNTNSRTRNEHSSKPSVSPSQSETSSQTSLSQCVFCQRSSRCNLHNLYSGRRH